MKAESEIWQVMAGGEIYQAELPMLKDWIVEGIVRPDDLVRKGNFKWIEANRAPALRRVFSGEEQPPFDAVAGTAMSLANAGATDAAHQRVAPAPASNEGWSQPSPARQTEATAWQPSLHEAPASDACSDAEPFIEAVSESPVEPEHCHAEHQRDYICRVCGATFCRACVKFPEGARIALCAQCGDFCRPFAEVRARQEHSEFQASGFGLGDFKLALAYPFKNVVSLLFGAALYAVLLFAGFRGQILAYAIIFGCISIVINKVAYGKLDKDFLPDFGSFSAWDDLFMPLLMGIGVTAVTIGPTLLLLAALLFGWIGGSPDTAPADSPALADAQAQTSQGADGSRLEEDIDTLLDSEADPQKQAEAMKSVQAMTPAGQISRQLEESEAEPGMARQVFGQLASRPGLIAILLLVTLGWAVLYYPMAVAVAGYTENIWSVVNPLVGLDTIRRMGLVYAKAFAMYAFVQAIGLVVGLVVGLVTAPFNLPLVGNLPATFIDGMLTFYINLVVACILGLAIFKSADRLGIETE